MSPRMRRQSLSQHETSVCWRWLPLKAIITYSSSLYLNTESILCLSPGPLGKGHRGKLQQQWELYEFYRIIQGRRDLRRSQSHLWDHCVAQGFIQMALEILREWRLHNFSGQSVPMLHCSHGEKVFYNIQSGTACYFNFCLLSFALLLWIT